MLLSILMLFLYKSYADLNRSNKQYSVALDQLNKRELIKKTLYLDLLMASKKYVIIQHTQREYDFISFKTKHSLHRRIEPFVTYLVKDHFLYRLESLYQITSININSEITFDVEKLQRVKKFKLFGTRDHKREFYLLHMKLKDNEDILLKVKVLN